MLTFYLPLWVFATLPVSLNTFTVIQGSVVILFPQESLEVPLQFSQQDDCYGQNWLFWKDQDQ